MTSLQVEREASSSHSGGSARTSPHASPVQELVSTLCVWSWSPHHRRRTSGEDSVEVATFAVDDCFLRRPPGEESMPVLVMRDRETRLLSAHAVPMKGAVVERTAQQVVRDFERLGHHGRLVIWCDQEAARSRPHSTHLYDCSIKILRRVVRRETVCRVYGT